MQNSKYKRHMAENCSYHPPSSSSCSTHAIYKQKYIFKNIKKYGAFLGRLVRGNGALVEKGYCTMKSRIWWMNMR